jgi:hypothetical protein
MPLDLRQKAFFTVFGYLNLKGLLRQSAARLENGVAAVLKTAASHPANRACISHGFIDDNEELAALLEDPLLTGVAADLLGDDFNYTGSSGGDSGDRDWHSVGWHAPRLHLSFIFCLDQKGQTGTTGDSLRLIPGSHVPGNRFADTLHRQLSADGSAWDMRGNQIPAVALQTEPGDLVCLDHNLKRAWFGGSRRLRLDLCQRYTDGQLADLGAYLQRWDLVRRDAAPFGPLLCQTPQRARRLEQVQACLQP